MNFGNSGNFRNFGAIVMAAGLGTRMKSELPKVLHPLCGKPMIGHVLDLLVKAKAKKVAIVVSYGKEEVMGYVREAFSKQVTSKTFVFVDQKKPLGTGHAVLKTEAVFKSFSGPIVILSGDVPALSLETVKKLLAFHAQGNTELTLTTAILDTSIPYGRVIRDMDEKVVSVIEAKDASAKELQVTEMNMGLYVANAHVLFSSLKKVKPNNAKHEYYLTDIVSLVDNKAAFLIENAEEVMGINSRDELSKREAFLREKINRHWMIEGVTLRDPKTTYIGVNVVLGSDVTIEPGVSLQGRTRIQSGSTVGEGSVVRNSQIGKQVTIKEYCVVDTSVIEDFAIVGPFARIRPESRMRKYSRVGNFVELKKTVLGEGSKANHLTYLGDAVIGKEANIGCGVITCNYDGGIKYDGKAKTVIGDKSFVGSDCQLIAPVTLNKGSYVASGTTVTQNVPPDSLVIARAPQVTKKGYMKKIWARANKEKNKRTKK